MAQNVFVTLLGLVLSLVTGSAFAWVAFEYCLGRLMHSVKRDVPPSAGMTATKRCRRVSSAL